MNAAMCNLRTLPLVLILTHFAHQQQQNVTLATHARALCPVGLTDVFEIASENE